MVTDRRHVMHLVSRVEILLDIYDDPTKKLLDNSKKIRRDLEAVKKQISLSKKKVTVPEEQIRSLNILDANADAGLRDDGRPRIDDRDAQANRDCLSDEERMAMSDIEEYSGCAVII